MLSAGLLFVDGERVGGFLGRGIWEGEGGEGVYVVLWGVGLVVEW